MVTVQHLVKRELEKNPFLIDIIQQDLVNINAVSAKIYPTIKKEMGREIKISAIGMGIRRYNTEISKKAMFNWKFPENLEISTKSQIYEVAIEKTPQIGSIIKEIYRHVKRNKGEFLSITEGTYEICIFTNQVNKEFVKNALKWQKITSEHDNLAYVTVNWEKLTKDIPGIYYRVTRSLAFKNISMYSLYTIGSEMMIFFKEDVFLDAYQTIVNILQNKTAL